MSIRYVWVIISDILVNCLCWKDLFVLNLDYPTEGEKIKTTNTIISLSLVCVCVWGGGVNVATQTGKRREVGLR